ncbi:MAG: PEP-CTERM sorting domain-containing protein [Verrucomicrobia bacterium]|nr:PEP-CTERM sorting domain-containing protein [Verrucomicrobiota bacterium]
MINIGGSTSRNPFAVSRKFISFAVFIAASLVTRISGAAVLTEYQFTNNRTSSNVPVGAVASTFNNGAGMTTNIVTGYRTTTPSSTIDPSLFTLSSDTSSTEAGAVTNNNYYTFTLTPNAGIVLDLTSLTFRYALDNSGGSTGFNATYFVRSSIDNFATDVGSVPASAGKGKTTAFTTANIDLTASQFQNLSSAVTFRIYIYDNSNTTTQQDLLDDVIVNGSLALVPEPSTYAMMGLGIGLLAAAQRFRRSRRSA